VSDLALTDADALVQRIADIGRCVVAYSGGVDSAVVAAAALHADQRRLNEEPAKSLATSAHRFSIAVTADSPSVSREQLETAQRVAGELGLAHEIIATEEMSRDEYRANDRRRCFYCKETLYEAIGKFAASQNFAAILSGTNADDLGDYRPGIEAGRIAGVIAPLAELGLTKKRVRDVAKLWNISVANRPAQPCLSSRIAYGVSVTRERLKRIEEAESFLRERGYTPLRVRVLPDEQASIEVSLAAISQICDAAEFASVTHFCQSIGFRSVVIDPRGFRSGSLNELVQLVAPTPESGSR
jgi:pyridinium-3,5-biscarboxylic acid mononucleotide sulfurtransferase